MYRRGRRTKRFHKHPLDEATFPQLNPQLGNWLKDVKSYFQKTYNLPIDHLESFLVSRSHYDYYEKYRSQFAGLKELGNKYDRGSREGYCKLQEDIYLVFCHLPLTRDDYVLAFAPSVKEVSPYLLNTAHGKVFTADYDGDIVPYEIKNAPDTIFLNNNMLEEFQYDVLTFLESSSFYKEKKIVYKRGVLFYGHPGNGKTVTATWAATKFDKVFVITPSIASPYLAKNINNLCSPEESKLIILEDLDALNEDTSDLLNFIDGSVEINRAYFIGTTNYPDRLHENILSRPSRFDLFLEVERPNFETREKLLRHHLPGFTDEEYTNYSKLSDGLNASYFQEMAVLKHKAELVNKSFSVEQIIDKCKKRVKLVRTKDFEKDSSPVGFGSAD